MKKVAVVTGASRGIGRAIAKRLARDGATVVVNYAQSHEDAQALAEDIHGWAFPADLGVVGDVRKLFAAVAEKYERLDILVNNAGVARMQPVADVSEEEFERIFAINTRGVFFALQEAAKRMGEGGRIVNVSTGATVASPAESAVYTGSKAAVEQFTRVLARELGSRRITVNTVSPGFTDTDMLRSVPGLAENGPKITPLGRLGTPEDVADVVAFLCSEEGRWITGQNIQAGGGASML
jgi:3-oxoacyl-[acyl-carrier protein] reductase